MSSEKWSHSEGERPNTVTVYERKPGGIIYARAWDPTARGGEGNWVRRSLGHRDKRKAKRYAREQTVKLEQGEGGIDQNERLTLARVFALYAQHVTPGKSEAIQGRDKRRIDLWTSFLGSKKDPHEISAGEWRSFIEARGSGAIDSRGNPVPEGKRRPVVERTVAIDLKFLRAVLSWAAEHEVAPGRTLMRRNPVGGTRGRKSSTFPIPKGNPRRPVASQDRYEKLLAAAQDHTMEVRANGKREKRRSYLRELLTIVNGTGRRISAVCALRYDDLRLERTETRPHGAIRWRADEDKEGLRTVIPISPPVRKAIDRILRERPAAGAVPLFPAPGDLSKPMSRHLADKWLREAEQLAKVEPQQGTLWHAYRRKWVMERKHLSDVDVTAAGGWQSTQTLKKVYQQPDERTTLDVVLGGGELREAR